MTIKVRNFQNKDIEDISLDPSVFSLSVRPDILSRVVSWQLAKRRSGNHKTKGISDISGTTRKPHRQKGTGRARQGSLRSPQFRGGATIFGPVVRSHAFSLPKKIRSLGLKHALSSKNHHNQLVVVDSLSFQSSKTKDFSKALLAMGIHSALIVGGESILPSFWRLVQNIPCVDILPIQGLNVYDILNHHTLVLSKNSLSNLEKRFQ